MQIVPRLKLRELLRGAEWNPHREEGDSAEERLYLTVREAEPMPFEGGAHRKLTYPDGRVEGPFPVANRPALTAFLEEAFAHLGSQEALASLPEGAFWLNNKAQAERLSRVPDAQTLSLFLRRRGLTDRFRGGFRLRASEFTPTLSTLAAHPYVGGADVLFTSLRPSALSLTALACHYFDLHFATSDAAVRDALADLARERGLLAETLFLPDLPELPALGNLLE